MAAGTSGAPSVETSGQRAVLPPCRTVELSDVSDSSSPEQSIRVVQFWTSRVGLAGQRDELLEVPDGLLPVASGLSGAPRTGETPIAIRVLLERGLELPQRGCRLPDLEQQLTEQVTHWVQSVLHRHVLDAAIFAVGGRAHELRRLVARTLRVRHPGGDGKDLLLSAIGPIRLARLLEGAAQLLQRLDLTLRPGQIAAARHAEPAGEAGQGVGHAASGRGDRQRSCTGPVGAL